MDIIPAVITVLLCTLYVRTRFQGQVGARPEPLGVSIAHNSVEFNPKELRSRLVLSKYQRMHDPNDILKIRNKQVWSIINHMDR